MSFGSSNSPPEMSSRFGVDLLRGMTSAPAVEVKKGTSANWDPSQGPATPFCAFGANLEDIVHLCVLFSAGLTRPAITGRPVKGAPYEIGIIQI